MKAFCFIFIVHVVALLAYPCGDIFPDVPQNDVNGTYVSRIGGGATDDATQDECSIICICSCCSHSLFIQTLSFSITSRPDEIATAAAIIEYTNPYSAHHSNSIWQPPKA